MEGEDWEGGTVKGTLGIGLLEIRNKITSSDM